ncbi:nucleopolyhedrovirus P10 family protein [Streptomyces sp. NPDC052225]|uniref:nucleopolyhedrovirus P10 family protein n=1 Tax=Streptomyces sp. NPDC052225 TaxID=3154949 RepID=UPI0034173663
MTVDRWGQAVRQQLGLGRLLPLGGPGDGAWITEPAARAALSRAVEEVRGVRLGALRLDLADPEAADEPAVPAPPSALPPGPLRIEAQCAATAEEPLPAAAGRLRDALARAARDRLGLVIAEVDLQVTALLDEDPAPQEDEAEPSEPEPAGKQSAEGDEGRVAEAALAVPGVVRLTGSLGGLGRAVHIESRPAEAAASLPRRHVRVELAVSPDARALDVARAVREAVATALADGPTVAVLVTR